MTRTLPAGIVISQYPEVIYPAVSNPDTSGMEETEHWRLRLLELEAASGLPLLKEMAEKLNVEASYYSRLRYPPGKKGRKNLGLETLRAAVKAFELQADWFDLPLGTALPNSRTATQSGPRPIDTKGNTRNIVAMDEPNPAAKTGVLWPFKETSYTRLQSLLDSLDKHTKAEAIRDLDTLLAAGVIRWEKRADQLRKQAS